MSLRPGSDIVTVVIDRQVSHPLVVGEDDGQVGLVVVAPGFSLVPGQESLTEQVAAALEGGPLQRTASLY